MEGVKEKIAEIQRKCSEAIKNKNIKGVTDLYCEDCRFMPPGVPSAEGRTGVEKLYKEAFSAGVVILTSTTLEVNGTPEEPWERGEFVTKYEDGVIAENGKYVVTYKTVDGKLLIYLHIWNVGLHKE